VCVCVCVCVCERVSSFVCYPRICLCHRSLSVALPQSERQFPILGLHLLFLLANNRIAEFHTELEWIPIEVADNPYIRFARELEQFFMEGSYHKVLQASQAIPLPYYASFMDKLAGTVRYVRVDDKSAQKGGAVVNK
jgi:hypothetical protein